MFFALVELEIGRLSPIDYNSVYLKYLPQVVHIHRWLGLKINFIYLNFIVLLFLLSSMHHTFVNFLVQNGKGRFIILCLY